MSTPLRAFVTNEGGRKTVTFPDDTPLDLGLVDFEIQDNGDISLRPAAMPPSGNPWLAFFEAVNGAPRNQDWEAFIKVMEDRPMNQLPVGRRLFREDE